ncbi:glycosyltransferase family 28 protein [Necator americanus]|uniref:UDP-N-acetylglucosamine transferase subunit ALG13 n=1 Tax=Necator americanus TaxID=51031 RepID=W2T244_NECAM|nr:glycosyltransferase family 28 protein [Necator americanus]ETN76075.1 glycosyltransferase family 28 protein [Necator americanus]
MTCFVTVGTTRFDELVNEVFAETCTSALRSIGVRKITVQLGAGEWNDEIKRNVFQRIVADHGDGETRRSREYFANVLIVQMRSTCKMTALRLFIATEHMAGGIPVEYYRFKPNIQDDIENALLVIGHAGAGTCLECLKMKKPFIVVVNENLMDNHQLELAKELARGEHLLYCTVSNLSVALMCPSLFSLKPFVQPDQSLVAKFIDHRVGLAPS